MKITTILSILLVLSLMALFSYSYSYSDLSRELEIASSELEKLEGELSTAQTKIKDLQKKPKRTKMLVPSGHDFHMPEKISKKKASLDKESEEERTQRIAAMQVAAAGRILSLTEDEKLDLEEMYRARRDETEPFIAIEDILGEERANLIRDEQRNAFSRSELEDVERDAYYFSRKFSLTDTQEIHVLNALTEVQQRVKDEREVGGSADTPRERMQRMLAETRLYRSLMMERMQKILSEKQLDQ